MSATAGVDVSTVQGWIAEHFAAWVQALRLQVTSVAAGEIELRLPFDDALVRSGGTLSGQALMAAADTAMALAIAAHAGTFRPMTTVGLTTSFLRPVSGGDARVIARVLKPGRTLAFGEVEIVDARDGKLAAHVTTTYAML